MPRGGCWPSLALGQEWLLRLAIRASHWTSRGAVPSGIAHWDKVVPTHGGSRVGIMIVKERNWKSGEELGLGLGPFLVSNLGWD